MKLDQSRQRIITLSAVFLLYNSCTIKKGFDIIIYVPLHSPLS
nr:MAG TPA: hypothetical protein [Caudoviricetes sp.]